MRTDSPTETRTAMVVEDCDALSYILCKLLSREGFAVRAFSSAVEALEAWRTDGAPALLVTDVTLPQLSGVELIRRLQAERRLGQTRVIIVTASAQVHSPLTHAVVLTKPFSLTGLQDAVNRALPFGACGDRMAESAA